ncbi:MAG: type II secretion system protein N [Limnohabitans sp.]
MSRQHLTPHTHTSRRWAWAGASLGLGLALLTQAPAVWLTHALAQASGERLLWQDPQGTVWNGSAQWVLSDGASHNQARNSSFAAPPSTALPSRVQWQLRPHLDMAHARVGLRATLSTACCLPHPVQLDVAPRWRGVQVQVSDHTALWPAAMLVGLGAPWNTIQPGGQLQSQTQGLQWTRQAGVEQVQGHAELQWQQASTQLTTLRPLGSYRVQLQGGDTLALTLDTLEGSLRLQGSGHLQNGRVHFSGEASAAPDAEAALSNLLNILGQRQGAKSILKLG